MNICRNFKKINKNTYKKFIDKRNLSMNDKFKNVPFADRMIFIPHCMRNVKVCKAIDKGAFYICVQCKGCKISDITTLAKQLGYKETYIMKGGRAIENILKTQKPKAIIGIACYFEGAQAIKMTDKAKILTQFIPLTKDGCADTDIDLEETKIIIALEK